MNDGCFSKYESLITTNTENVSSAVSNGSQANQSTARSTSCSNSANSANQNDFVSRSKARYNSIQRIRNHRIAAAEEQKKLVAVKPKVPEKIDLTVKRPAQYTQPVEKWIYDEIMLKHNIPGVQVVFAVGNDIVYDNAFGYASIEEDRKADTSNFHRIASVSKAVTRAVLDVLVKRNQLDTSQKVFTKFLTEFNIKRNPRLCEITVQHLIDHEVGLWGTVGANEDPMFCVAHQFSQAEVI